MASVCFVVGARPNFMKAAPVIRALNERRPDVETILVHTGQHYDPEMSDVFLQELGLPQPDVYLGVGSGTQAEQTARALTGVEQVLLERRPALTVVAGDVNSTLGGALAAKKAETALAHIESGLRSFDPTMPEEHNRKVTDDLSDILLVHSQSAIDNLAHEGVDPERVHFVGNTMIDSLLEHLEPARERKPWERLGHERNAYGLVTLHRPGLVDDEESLAASVQALWELERHFPVVFPVHPRTHERMETLGLDAPGVTAPLGYFDFLGLEAEARFVLTDSGGVQEETAVLGVPCFTLRDNTERPVTIELGTNTLLGARPERITDIPDLLAEKRRYQTIPLWDGKAGERAAEVLDGFLAGRPLPAFA